MKVRFAVAVTVVAASIVAVGLSAQTPSAPPMQSILAGKKFIPPIKGQAEIDIVKSPTRREGTTLVTKIQVRNMSAAPIPRLKVVETWYDKNGGEPPDVAESVDVHARKRHDQGSRCEGARRREGARCEKRHEHQDC
jgi:hypothetical protein